MLFNEIEFISFKKIHVLKLNYFNHDISSLNKIFRRRTTVRDGAQVCTGVIYQRLENFIFVFYLRL